VAPIFTPLPDKPDHNALELEILETWERDKTFESLRAQNAGGPRFSFVDGRDREQVVLVSTNSLKDVFSAKAMRGFHQRYQNDSCQALDRGGVERDLAQLEAGDRGVRPAEPARRCARWRAVAQSPNPVRLGQWMDWERLLTPPTRTSRHLAVLQIGRAAGSTRPPSTEGPRCGTSSNMS
jgi:hypothetical protein